MFFRSPSKLKLANLYSLPVLEGFQGLSSHQLGREKGASEEMGPAQKKTHVGDTYMSAPRGLQRFPAFSDWPEAEGRSPKLDLFLHRRARKSSPKTANCMQTCAASIKQTFTNGK